MTDLRRGLNGLSALVQTVLAMDVFASHVFAFRGRRGDLIKVLWWDGGYGGVRGIDDRSGDAPSGNTRVADQRHSQEEAQEEEFHTSTFGSDTLKVLPLSTALSTSMKPPWASTVVALAVRQGAFRARAVAVFPVWLFSGLHEPAAGATLATLFWYFAEGGAFVFGSGLAIVPFLYGGVVGKLHWLTERQFLDAVAVAIITPGPVVMTVAFIGHLVTGPLGATAAALGVFLPCYLIGGDSGPVPPAFCEQPATEIVCGWSDCGSDRRNCRAAFVLGRRAIFDVPTALIAIVTLVILLKTKRVAEPLVIVLAGVVGLIIRG